MYIQGNHRIIIMTIKYLDKHYNGVIMPLFFYRFKSSIIPFRLNNHKYYNLHAAAQQHVCGKVSVRIDVLTLQRCAGPSRVVVLNKNIRGTRDLAYAMTMQFYFIFCSKGTRGVVVCYYNKYIPIIYIDRTEKKKNNA